MQEDVFEDILLPLFVVLSLRDCVKVNLFVVKSVVTDLFTDDAKEALKKT